MKQITEDYVSYKIAKLLKEKGFNERGLCVYTVEEERFYTFGDWVENSCLLPHLISAPTHQMAIKWLREVHKWSIQVFPVFDNLKWCYDIYELKIQKYQSRPELLSNMDYDTYEQAVEAALLYTLKNLI